MEPEPKPPQQPEKPLAERMIKYLPIFVISHALVTIPTFIISIALAYATFVQADATRKIQMSETWPYVSYGTSNATPDGTQGNFARSCRTMASARRSSKQMEFLYKGKPMPNPREFLRQCCAGDAEVQLHERAGHWRASARREDRVHSPRHETIRTQPSGTSSIPSVGASSSAAATARSSTIAGCSITARSGPQPVDAVPGGLEDVRRAAVRRNIRRQARQDFSRPPRPFPLPLRHGASRRTHPDDAAVPAAQGRGRRRLAVLPDGRFLRAVLRRCEGRRRPASTSR